MISRVNMRNAGQNLIAAKAAGLKDQSEERKNKKGKRYRAEDLLNEEIIVLPKEYRVRMRY